MGATVTLAFGALAGSSARQAPLCSQEELNWLPSYAEGQTAARQSNKPIFLVFR
jgi:hypothetical protein